MKKILFIIWTYSQGGGAEKILANLVNNLDPNRYEVDILEVEHYGIKQENTNSNIKILTPLYDGNNRKLGYKFYKYLRVLIPNLIRKKSVHKKYDYEIAFNYLYPTYFLDNKAITISWMHGSIENLLTDDLNRKRQLKYLRKVNKIVGISDQTINSIKQVYPMLEHKITKIYNGYDINAIIKKADEYTINDQDYLCYIGRLEHAKGVMELLDLYYDLYQKGIRKHLYYLGTGELLDTLKKQVHIYGLDDYVHIEGYVQNPYPYIKKASYVVSCSKAEGFPTIFVEGLVLGVGFVSSEVGGVSELYNQGLCGFYGNYQLMQDYLYNELIKLPNNRIIQKQNCTNFVTQFSLENQVKAFESLLNSLSKGEPK